MSAIHYNRFSAPDGTKLYYGLPHAGRHVKPNARHITTANPALVTCLRCKAAPEFATILTAHRTTA